MVEMTTGHMNSIGTSQILMVSITNSNRKCYIKCKGTRTRRTTVMSLVKVTSLARTRTRTMMTMATATRSSKSSTVERREKRQEWMSFSRSSNC